MSNDVGVPAADRSTWRDDATAGIVRPGEPADRHRLVDRLTGLPNRRAFLRVATTDTGRLVDDRWFGVIDIDHIDHVNDRYGRAAGDRLLAGVAERWRATLDCEAVLARTGGDEFGFSCPVHADAAAVAHRLATALFASIDVGHGERLVVTCSIGIALGHVGDHLDDVLARAGDALHEVKQGGCCGAIVHDE